MDEGERNSRSKKKSGRRSSILKPPKVRNPLSDLDFKTDDDCTATRNARRVSFASNYTIKPFTSDEHKNTIWDSTYEEEITPLEIQNYHLIPTNIVECKPLQDSFFNIIDESNSIESPENVPKSNKCLLTANAIYHHSVTSQICNEKLSTPSTISKDNFVINNISNLQPKISNINLNHDLDVKETSNISKFISATSKPVNNLNLLTSSKQKINFYNLSHPSISNKSTHTVNQNQTLPLVDTSKINKENVHPVLGTRQILIAPKKSNKKNIENSENNKNVGANNSSEVEKQSNYENQCITSLKQLSNYERDFSMHLLQEKNNTKEKKSLSDENKVVSLDMDIEQPLSVKILSRNTSTSVFLTDVSENLNKQIDIVNNYTIKSCADMEITKPISVVEFIEQKSKDTDVCDISDMEITETLPVVKILDKKLNTSSSYVKDNIVNLQTHFEDLNSQVGTTKILDIISKKQGRNEVLINSNNFQSTDVNKNDNLKQLEKQSTNIILKPVTHLPNIHIEVKNKEVNSEINEYNFQKSSCFDLETTEKIHLTNVLKRKSENNAGNLNCDNSNINTKTISVIKKHINENELKQYLNLNISNNDKTTHFYNFNENSNMEITKPIPSQKIIEKQNNATQYTDIPMDITETIKGTLKQSVSVDSCNNDNNTIFFCNTHQKSNMELTKIIPYQKIVEQKSNIENINNSNVININENKKNCTEDDHQKCKILDMELTVAVPSVQIVNRKDQFKNKDISSKSMLTKLETNSSNIASDIYQEVNMELTKIIPCQKIIEQKSNTENVYDIKVTENKIKCAEDTMISEMEITTAIPFVQIINRKELSENKAISNISIPTTIKINEDNIVYGEIQNKESYKNLHSDIISNSQSLNTTSKTYTNNFDESEILESTEAFINGKLYSSFRKELGNLKETNIELPCSYTHDSLKIDNMVIPEKSISVICTSSGQSHINKSMQIQTEESENKEMKSIMKSSKIEELDNFKIPAITSNTNNVNIDNSLGVSHLSLQSSALLSNTNSEMISSCKFVESVIPADIKSFIITPLKSSLKKNNSSVKKSNETNIEDNKKNIKLNLFQQSECSSLKKSQSVQEKLTITHNSNSESISSCKFSDTVIPKDIGPLIITPLKTPSIKTVISATNSKDLNVSNKKKCVKPNLFEQPEKKEVTTNVNNCVESSHLLAEKSTVFSNINTQMITNFNITNAIIPPDIGPLIITPLKTPSEKMNSLVKNSEKKQSEKKKKNIKLNLFQLPQESTVTTAENFNVLQKEHSIQQLTEVEKHLTNYVMENKNNVFNEKKLNSGTSTYSKVDAISKNINSFTENDEKSIVIPYEKNRNNIIENKDLGLNKSNHELNPLPYGIMPLQTDNSDENSSFKSINIENLTSCIDHKNSLLALTMIDLVSDESNENCSLTTIVTETAKKVETTLLKHIDKSMHQNMKEEMEVIEICEDSCSQNTSENVPENKISTKIESRVKEIVGVDEVNEMKSIIEPMIKIKPLTIKECCELKAASYNCMWKIEKITSNSWNFSFFFSKLHLLIYTDEKIENSEHQKVLKISYESLLKDTAPLECFYVIHSFQKKFSLKYLNKRCITIQNIPSMLDDMSAEAYTLMHIFRDIGYIKLKYGARFKEKWKIKFSIASIPLRLAMAVHIDLEKDIDNVEIETYTSQSRATDIIELANNIATGPSWLRNFVDDVNNLIDMLEFQKK